tara:strand:- start:226 stop:549 length:324 start_codon:yes stop_codon:yes gene_type:complete
MPENPFFKYAFSLMFIVIVILLLTDRGNALEQLENEGPIYGECKYLTETVIENGVEISRKETRVCDETREIGKDPSKEEEWTQRDLANQQMFETGLILFFLFVMENM